MKKHGMRNNILFLCIMSVLVALIVQMLLFNYVSTKTIYAQTREANLHSLNNMRDDLRDVTAAFESKLLDIYNESDLMHDMHEHLPVTEMQDKYYRYAYNMAQSFEAQDHVVALYIYDDFNRLISAYRHASTPVYNYPEDIFEGSAKYNVAPLRRFIAAESNVMLVSSYYNNNRKEDIVRFALNIFSDSYPRDQIGCIVCDADSSVFNDILAEYPYERDNIIWVQPEGDRIITAAGGVEGGYAEEYDRLTYSIARGENMNDPKLSISGEVLFEIRDSRYNFGIYSLMPPSLLIENQRILTRNLIIISILLILVTGFFGIMLARGITKPLETLSETMQKIRKGDTDLRVASLGNDEIGELGDNFNKMLDEMEHLIAREYSGRLQLQMAEYKALQAQINPHFLYNTLDTMSSIAQIQKCGVVSNLSESLSTMFRYSLDMDSPMSTVWKEILHLKNYIRVMDVRMNADVHYEFDIDERMRNALIPRLTLQPIVENALKYAFVGDGKDKTIRLTAGLKDGEGVIEVTDNGIGMNPDKLNAELKSNDLTYAYKGDSIGLHNINMRIKLLFGNEYGVRIESDPGDGAKVIARFPIRYEEADSEEETGETQE